MLCLNVMKNFVVCSLYYKVYYNSALPAGMNLANIEDFFFVLSFFVFVLLLNIHRYNIY